MTSGPDLASSRRWVRHPVATRATADASRSTRLKERRSRSLKVDSLQSPFGKRGSIPDACREPAARARRRAAANFEYPMPAEFRPIELTVPPELAGERLDSAL